MNKKSSYNLNQNHLLLLIIIQASYTNVYLQTAPNPTEYPRLDKKKSNLLLQISRAPSSF